jgi:hypothetical protein
MATFAKKTFDAAAYLKNRPSALRFLLRRCPAGAHNLRIFPSPLVPHTPAFLRAAAYTKAFIDHVIAYAAPAAKGAVAVDLGCGPGCARLLVTLYNAASKSICVHRIAKRLVYWLPLDGSARSSVSILAKG